MKVIFLDIDGVLNSNDTCVQYHEATGKDGYGGWFKETDKCTHDNVIWGQKLVENLKYIVDSTGAVIVISSTWRKHFTLSKFKEMFSVYGWHDAPVIDKTPASYERHRGDEIKEWLSNGPEVDSYVIIDDDTDFYKDQQQYFVNTDFFVGLSINDALNAINILNTTLNPLQFFDRGRTKLLNELKSQKPYL